VEQTVTREIIEIDEDKCTGCGQCVVNCPEGALEITDGKARVVNEHFCDGLGACIGECPEGALQIVERDAPVFAEAAVLEYAALRKVAMSDVVLKLRRDSAVAAPCHCPSARLIEWSAPSEQKSNAGRVLSVIRQWPLKLRLLPPNAPFLRETKKLVIISDCAGLANPNTHTDFLKGAALVQVCPKFENPSDNIDKLASIFQYATALKSVEVVEMTVPCCRSLLPEVEEALRLSGANIPVVERVIDPCGEEVS